MATITRGEQVTTVTMDVQQPLTPYELGQLDAIEDESFCPEAYYATQWQMDQYAVGYHQQQPEHERARAWVDALWQQMLDESDEASEQRYAGTPGRI